MLIKETRSQSDLAKAALTDPVHNARAAKSSNMTMWHYWSQQLLLLLIYFFNFFIIPLDV